MNECSFEMSQMFLKYIFVSFVSFLKFSSTNCFSYRWVVEGSLNFVLQAQTVLGNGVVGELLDTDGL